MKIKIAIISVVLLACLGLLFGGCAPLLIGGVVGYEVGKHPHKAPHIDWR